MTRLVFLTIAIVSALALRPDPVPAQQPYCKLALALGLDISSSVNSHEYRLQLDGLAWALSRPEVIDAVLTPPGAFIEAAVYEWSGYPQQDVLIGWSRLDSQDAILAFANRLASHSRRHDEYATALGKAVEFGAKLLHAGPDCARKVLDVSGDGENNVGVGPDFFERQGLLDGLIVNGLVILGAYPNPAIYYRQYVIRGPGAFLAQAMTFEDYRHVMAAKLLREIDTEMVLGYAP
ncbi:MAG: DUF1194 domain-containing protein [Pseudomonadota bacterium]